VVKMSMLVLRFITPRGLGNIFSTEDGGSTFLRKIGIYLQPTRRYNPEGQQRRCNASVVYTKGRKFLEKLSNYQFLKKECAL
jgi:hypothetical protein